MSMLIVFVALKLNQQFKMMSGWACLYSFIPYKEMWFITTIIKVPSYMYRHANTDTFWIFRCFWFSFFLKASQHSLIRPYQSNDTNSEYEQKKKKSHEIDAPAEANPQNKFRIIHRWPQHLLLPFDGETLYSPFIDVHCRCCRRRCCLAVDAKIYEQIIQ